MVPIKSRVTSASWRHARRVHVCIYDYEFMISFSESRPVEVRTCAAGVSQVMTVPRKDIYVVDRPPSSTGSPC